MPQSEAAVLGFLLPDDVTLRSQSEWSDQVDDWVGKSARGVKRLQKHWPCPR